ncbi:peptidase A8 [Bacteroidetes bacterium UKL13-3]|jgi:signal peptidase II|nr:peptidase A8 [Bacteroidetes bacterium UKL13-3]HCP92634.1 lipoprotein signal peptidase [Bacteroidota bacterium]
MKNKLFLPIAIILGVLIIDQWVKYYIKTHFFLGEEIDVIGNWFKLHFTENYGMAFGMEFGGKSGKLILTLFRIVAIGFIGWYITSLIKKNQHTGYIASWTLIMAGAIGNLVDSIFYGVWFGYDTWLHGRVVDMFYFPIIRTVLPENFPLWGGEEFEFFRPVFNVADAAISIGFISILLFQRTFMKVENQSIEETPTTENQA